MIQMKKRLCHKGNNYKLFGYYVINKGHVFIKPGSSASTIYTWYLDMHLTIHSNKFR